MRSFAIEEPGSPVPALYATLASTPTVPRNIIHNFNNTNNMGQGQIIKSLTTFVPDYFYGATIILSCKFKFANLRGFKACFICTSVAFLLLELGVYHCCETHGTPEMHCCRRYRRIVAREIQKNPTFVRWHLMTAPT